MSHFYGYLQGDRGEVTRRGSAKNGIYAKLQSWHGRLILRLFHDEQGVDRFRLEHETDRNGTRVVCEGKVNEHGED